MDKIEPRIAGWYEMAEQSMREHGAYCRREAVILAHRVARGEGLTAEEQARALMSLCYLNETPVALKEMPYEQYLQTTHWGYMRRLKLHEASWRCQLCNDEENLQVHHRTYERRGNEDPADLLVLCRECHAKFHDKLP